MNLSVVYITSRLNPELKWFSDSLFSQVTPRDNIQIVIVDFFAEACDQWRASDVSERKDMIYSAFRQPYFIGRIKWVPPKPTVWAGPHRLTRLNWWAAASARNTGLCYARHDQIAFLDDRCVLMPRWLESVRRASKLGYAVCGPYEKRSGMTVENGVIRHGGIVTGEDGRLSHANELKAPNPFQCGGEWMFGCTFSLPTEWMLQVNGQDETCDGLSSEDSIFGLMVQNFGYQIFFDRGMEIVEDRTPGEIGIPMIRKDKGVSPNDKSHALLDMLKGRQRAMHPLDLRVLRSETLRGMKFPIPTEPSKDWYDGQLLKDM